MRILKFFLRFFLVLLFLFFLAATIYVRIYGKSLVEEALMASLKRNVAIGEATYHFPLGFRAYNVDISRSLQGGEFLRIKKVIAQLSPDAFFQRRFTFDLVFLIEPSLVVQREKDSSGVTQDPGKAEIPVTAGAVVSEGSQNMISAQVHGPEGQPEVVIRKLIVRKGNLQYKDGLTEKGFSFDLEDVLLKAEDLVFPARPGRSGFKMSGFLIKKGNPISGSHVTGSGWIDAVKKDMEAKIEVIEANGAIGLTANAVSQDNAMEVTGEISTQNLLGGLEKASSSESSAVNALVLNALSSSGIEITAKFAFKTQMDDFRIGQISFSGNVVSSSDAAK